MYDITIFGATGHTGRLCALFIAKSFPTSISCCLAGRSETGLGELAMELQREYPDRVQPEIEVLLDLQSQAISPLIRRTKVVINAIGPYHKFSTPIVEACAVEGTHYVDFTTETLWTKELIGKYELIAKESGAILIPGISPTAPADLLAWLITRQTRASFSTAPEKVIATGKLDIKAMSPGSIRTVLDSLETWGPAWYLSGDTSVLTTHKDNQVKTKSKPRKSLSTRIFGHTSIPLLGPSTTSLTGPGNASIVQRSADQNPDLYGPGFTYAEYLPATGVLSAVFIHVMTKIGIILLSVPLTRAFLRRLLTPIPTPTKARSDLEQEQLRHSESAEYHAVGFIENQNQSHPAVRGSFTRHGGLYEFTALLTCVGARVLLSQLDDQGRGRSLASEGGFVTPSFLGMGFVEGLVGAGVTIEVETLEVSWFGRPG